MDQKEHNTRERWKLIFDKRLIKKELKREKKLPVGLLRLCRTIGATRTLKSARY